MARGLINILGASGPLVVLLGIVILAVVLGQLISNTATVPRVLCDRRDVLRAAHLAFLGSLLFWLKKERAVAFHSGGAGVAP